VKRQRKERDKKKTWLAIHGRTFETSGRNFGKKGRKADWKNPGGDDINTTRAKHLKQKRSFSC